MLVQKGGDPRLQYSKGDCIQMITKEFSHERKIKKKILKKILDGYEFEDGYVISKYIENAPGTDSQLSEYLEYHEDGKEPVLISVVELIPKTVPKRIIKGGGNTIKRKRKTNKKNKSIKV